MWEKGGDVFIGRVCLHKFQLTTSGAVLDVSAV
jgi:hypothetical protein